MKRKKLFIYLIVAFFIVVSALLVQFIFPYRAESPVLDEMIDASSPAQEFEDSREGDKLEGTDQEPIRSGSEQEEVTQISAEEVCISEKVRLYEQSDHEKGSLLVSFEGDMSLDDASVILSARGLTYDQRDDLEEVFLDNPWLEVSVPEGEEFLWICRLEEHPSIRGAIPNTLINLRQ
jgi:hypothetical protein